MEADPLTARRSAALGWHSSDPRSQRVRPRIAQRQYRRVRSLTISGAANLGAVGLDWRLGGFAADPPTDNSGNVGIWG